MDREKQKIEAADAYVEERGYKTGQLDVAYMEGIEWADEHPKWKPSEVQMKSLKKAADEHWELDGNEPLYTLYQDLLNL